MHAQKRQRQHFSGMALQYVGAVPPNSVDGQSTGGLVDGL